MLIQIIKWFCIIIAGFGIADLTAEQVIDYPGIKYWQFLKKRFSYKLDIILVILGLIGLKIIGYY